MCSLGGDWTHMRPITLSTTYKIEGILGYISWGLTIYLNEKSMNNALFWEYKINIYHHPKNKCLIPIAIGFNS